MIGPSGLLLQSSLKLGEGPDVSPVRSYRSNGPSVLAFILLTCSSDGGPALTELYHVARLLDVSLARHAQFLVTTFREQQRLFDDPISELRIGIFSNSNRSVVTVHEHACLSEVLDLLETHGES